MTFMHDHPKARESIKLRIRIAIDFRCTFIYQVCVCTKCDNPFCQLNLHSAMKLDVLVS